MSQILRAVRTLCKRLLGGTRTSRGLCRLAFRTSVVQNMDSINNVHAIFSCPGQKYQYAPETGPDAVIFIDRKPCMGWSWISDSGDPVVSWEALLKLKYLPEEVLDNLMAAVRRGVVLGGS
jgi:hypothetical protein